jgi:2-dehydro-3-deoxyphosphogluconate aldolase/(4S)-4-hydroxy-2-oxoglutarate aldolase
MPTGGVTLTNAGDWIKAGASAVGIGSALATKEQVANRDYIGIEENAKLVLSGL